MKLLDTPLPLKSFTVTNPLAYLDQSISDEVKKFGNYIVHP